MDAPWRGVLGWKARGARSGARRANPCARVGLRALRRRTHNFVCCAQHGRFKAI